MSTLVPGLVIFVFFLSHYLVSKFPSGTQHLHLIFLNFFLSTFFTLHLKIFSQVQWVRRTSKVILFPWHHRYQIPLLRVMDYLLKLDHVFFVICLRPSCNAKQSVVSPHTDVRTRSKFCPTLRDHGKLGEGQERAGRKPHIAKKLPHLRHNNVPAPNS